VCFKQKERIHFNAGLEGYPGTGEGLGAGQIGLRMQESSFRLALWGIFSGEIRSSPIAFPWFEVYKGSGGQVEG